MGYVAIPTHLPRSNYSVSYKKGLKSCPAARLMKLGRQQRYRRPSRRQFRSSLAFFVLFTAIQVTAVFRCIEIDFSPRTSGVATKSQPIQPVAPQWLARGSTESITPPIHRTCPLIIVCVVAIALTHMHGSMPTYLARCYCIMIEHA